MIFPVYLAESGVKVVVAKPACEWKSGSEMEKSPLQLPGCTRKAMCGAVVVTTEDLLS